MGKPNARDRILETASELFHQRGYTAVGINEIIDKAGTAKATFYHHFSTKEKLGEAWLEAVHRRSEEGRKKILSSEGDPHEKLRRYFLDLKSFLKAGDYRGCPYTNTAAVIAEGEHCLQSQVEGHKVSIRKFFSHLAQEFVASTKETKQLGDALFLLYSGATTESQNLKALWPVESALKAAKTLVDSPSS